MKTFSRPQWLQRRRDDGGFTLLEMIIVLALMIVLAGMAALSFTSLEEGSGVEVYGNRLARMAKRASRDAVVQGRPIVIAFDQPDILHFGT